MKWQLVALAVVLVAAVVVVGKADAIPLEKNTEVSEFEAMLDSLIEMHQGPALGDVKGVLGRQKRGIFDVIKKSCKVVSALPFARLGEPSDSGETLNVTSGEIQQIVKLLATPDTTID